MASSGGILAPIAFRSFKHVFKKATTLFKARLTKAVGQSLQHDIQPVLARISPRQPVHPIAALRQGKGRWYITHSTINAGIRRFMSSEAGPKFNRAAFPKSATARAVSQLPIRAPFASTLRPNLTGGALPRTAGGYSLGGGRAGARYFSHTPAAPAQVVNNVSQAVRAFFLSGQKAQFDGVTATGEKKYRAVSNLREETTRKMQSLSMHVPGSYIDFPVNPTLTALTPLGVAFPFGPAMEMSAPNLNTEGFLDVLSVDFSRALKDLAATMNDLKRLARIGDLPITLEQKSVLRIRFPGCDAETVKALCDEMGVQRGIIYQDEEFSQSCGGEMALLFPFASSSECTVSSLEGSLRSHDFEEVEEENLGNGWLEGYESMEGSSEHESAYFTKPSPPLNSSGYEGMEGICRFIEECDNARRV